MRDCTIRAFGGCTCEDSECRSYAAEAKQITKAEQTLIAKRNVYPAWDILTFAFLLTAIVFGGLTLENHLKREALINQEVDHVARR